MRSLLAIAVTSTVSQRAARPLALKVWWAYRSTLALARKIQLSGVAVAKFLEGEIDGRGDAVGRETSPAATHFPRAGGPAGSRR